VVWSVHCAVMRRGPRSVLLAMFRGHNVGRVRFENLPHSGVKLETLLNQLRRPTPPHLLDELQSIQPLPHRLPGTLGNAP